MVFIFFLSASSNCPFIVVAEMADLKQQIEGLKHTNWIRRTQNLIAELPSTDRSREYISTYYYYHFYNLFFR